jgi:hypothetical protein
MFIFLLRSWSTLSYSFLGITKSSFGNKGNQNQCMKVMKRFAEPSQVNETLYGYLCYQPRTQNISKYKPQHHQIYFIQLIYFSTLLHIYISLTVSYIWALSFVYRLDNLFISLAEKTDVECCSVTAQNVSSPGRFVVLITCDGRWRHRYVLQWLPAGSCAAVPAVDESLRARHLSFRTSPFCTAPARLLPCQINNALAPVYFCLATSVATKRRMRDQTRMASHTGGLLSRWTGASAHTGPTSTLFS